MRVVVSDTGPLLHLWQARSQDLLELAGDVFIPPAVAREAVRHNAAWAAGLPVFVTVSSLESSYSVQAQVWQHAGLLHAGEAEALALALQLRADWFLTDDTSARVLSNSLGVEVHGSLGIVLWAAATRHITRAEAETALDQLAASSLWISARVLKEAKEALEQILATGSL